jgi:UDP-glucose 4-epimerase
MTKILVTGSSGFIGSNLVPKLNEVVTFDIREKPFHNVINPMAVEKFWHENKPDVVVHLAANPNPAMASWSCSQDAETNVLGTVNILEASLKCNVELLVYISTAHVSGNSPQLPLKETQVCNPQSLYATSKYVGELYCKHFARQGLPVVILRLFNVYGPNQSYGFVIPDLLRRVYQAPYKGGIVDILGPREDSRDFIYVEDVVNAILKAIENKPRDEIINVGSGVETTTQKLCQIIAHVLSKDVGFRYLERPLGRTPGRFQADISKAAHLIGWRPTISLEHGIEMTAAGFMRLEQNIKG